MLVILQKFVIFLSMETKRIFIYFIFQFGLIFWNFFVSYFEDQELYQRTAINNQKLILSFIEALHSNKLFKLL